MEKLLDHLIVEQREFRRETNEKLDRMGVKIDGVQSFKIEAKSAAKTMALFVSIICGFITLIATIITAFAMNK